MAITRAQPASHSRSAPRGAWLPRAEPAAQLHAAFIVSAALLFAGIYTAVDVVLPDRGTLPMVSALPGLILMLMQPGVLSARLFNFVAVPVLVVAVFALLGPSLETMAGNRATAIAQVAYSMLLGYAAVWALLRTGARRLRAILAVLVPVYIALLALEVALSPLQSLVRSYQEAVYPATADLDLIINREANMGGYRPKFFTSETSYVAVSVLLLVTAYLWTSRGLAGYFWAIAYTVAALIIVRSPIVAMLGPIIFVSAIMDPRYTQYRSLIGAGMATAMVVAGAAVLAIQGDVISTRLKDVASGRDYSTTFRTYGSFAVAINVIAEYPLFGAGPAGLDLVKEEIMATELSLGVPAKAVAQAWRISINNVPSSLLINFGLVGFVLGNWFLYALVTREVASPTLPVFVAIGLFGMASAVPYTPKFLVTTLIIVTFGSLRRQMVMRRKVQSPRIPGRSPDGAVYRPTSKGSRPPQFAPGTTLR